jgi:DNA-binding transcriptional MerR regulator
VAGGIMDKLENHEGFWGPAEELIDRAKCLQKAIGVNLKAITVRLVRYYAAEGVMDKPDRLGREAAYHYKHLLQLLLARKLSERRVMLADIKILVAGHSVVELESKLKGSAQPLLDEIKRRRAKETAEKAIDPVIREGEKAEQPSHFKPDLDGLTYQLKHMGESLRTIVNEVDTLGKTNLELAIQNEKLLHTIDEVHYHLRESSEFQKIMLASFERLRGHLNSMEMTAREKEIASLARVTTTIDQLSERIALLEDSLHRSVCKPDTPKR